MIDLPRLSVCATQNSLPLICLFPPTIFRPPGRISCFTNVVLMRFWKDVNDALALTDALTAVIATKYRANLNGRPATDRSVERLMLGKGHTAARVAVIVMDLGEAEWTRQGYERFLIEALDLPASVVERAIDVKFPQDGSEGFVISRVVRAELAKVGAHTIASNLDKFLRGFEAAGLLERKPTGCGSEMGYRLTVEGHRIEDLVHAQINQEAA